MGPSLEPTGPRSDDEEIMIKKRAYCAELSASRTHIRPTSLQSSALLVASTYILVPRHSRIMATGIECVGIVLAILPLLVTGIQAYSKGMSTISRARKYQSILGTYSFDLRREYTEFRNSWFRIVQLADFNRAGLRGIAPDLNLQMFRENPQNAVAGQNIDLKTVLSLALQSFDVSGLNDIERTIEELSRLITVLAMDFNLITIHADRHPMVCVKNNRYCKLWIKFIYTDPPCFNDR